MAQTGNKKPGTTSGTTETAGTITRSVSIKTGSLKTWKSLTNKSASVQLFLSLAELLEHSDDINKILRKEIKKREKGKV